MFLIEELGSSEGAFYVFLYTKISHENGFLIKYQKYNEHW